MNWLNLRHERFFAVFPSGYRVFKPLVWFVCLGLIAYVWVAFSLIASHDRFYVLNDNPVSVENPFFNSNNKYVPDYLSSMETLPAGFEAGYNHGWAVANAPLLSLFALALGALTNHISFNMGVLFDKDS